MRSKNRIVEILRDFFEVHRLVDELARRHDSVGLRFPELAVLIGDDESSVLFRLKERSHAFFREPGEDRRPSHREALFDLAVGSLFHEAMKLRENLYQREVYGPRVRALHSDAGEDSKALFEEFEKMLETVGERLDEGVQELQDLVARTSDQLRMLVVESSNEVAARFLCERPDRVLAVFGTSLDDVLSQMFGDPAHGLMVAGRSYLEAGAFERAAQVFTRALDEPDPPAEVSGLCDYAEGMAAYLSRDYAKSVARLTAWAAGGPPDARWVPLARDAVASLSQLAFGEDRDRVVSAAQALADRLGEDTRRAGAG
ncbi:MAG: hypothetical protein AAF430_10335 [Myxococcota bacterium]